MFLLCSYYHSYCISLLYYSYSAFQRYKSVLHRVSKNVPPLTWHAPVCHMCWQSNDKLLNCYTAEEISTLSGSLIKMINGPVKIT